MVSTKKNQGGRVRLFSREGKGTREGGTPSALKRGRGTCKKIIIHWKIMDLKWGYLFQWIAQPDTEWVWVNHWTSFLFRFMYQMYSFMVAMKFPGVIYDTWAFSLLSLEFCCSFAELLILACSGCMLILKVGLQPMTKNKTNNFHHKHI